MKTLTGYISNDKRMSENQQRKSILAIELKISFDFQVSLLHKFYKYFKAPRLHLNSR